VTADFRQRELRYGSREFLAASDLARQLLRPRVPALLGNVARDPALIRALIAIWRLPVVDLRVGRTAADAWFGYYFGPVRRWRPAQSVLELPAAEERYLVGRPRQALRTNLRHARDVGVTSVRVPYEAWTEAASVILRVRHDVNAPGQKMDKPGPEQQMAYYVARDACGTPLAFAGAALFGQFGVLFGLVSRPDIKPGASWARYQLHTCLALDLGRSGVRHLLAGSAIRQPHGTQYFQHLLGYRVRNLHVEVVADAAIEPAVPKATGLARAGHTRSRQPPLAHGIQCLTTERIHPAGHELMSHQRMQALYPFRHSPSGGRARRQWLDTRRSRHRFPPGHIVAMRRLIAAAQGVVGEPGGHVPHQPRSLQPAHRRIRSGAGQVVQGGKRAAIGQPRRRLDDVREATRAAMGDGE
jgi:hypothetical protein